MKKCKILITALFLMVGIMICKTDASAYVEENGNCGNNGANVTWELDDQGVLTISGTGKMMDYVTSSDTPLPFYDIKKVVIQYGVTHIGNYAFSCSLLTSVTIPSSVTSIGKEAFISCDNLTSVIIPDSVTSIGERAFSFCDNLASVVTTNGIKKIDESVFEFCPKLVCEKCGYSSIKNYKLHVDIDWSLFKVTKKATRTKEGSGYDYCSKCKRRLKNCTIPKLKAEISNWASISLNPGIKSLKIKMKNAIAGDKIILKVGKKTYKKTVTKTDAKRKYAKIKFNKLSEGKKVKLIIKDKKGKTQDSANGTVGYERPNFVATIMYYDTRDCYFGVMIQNCECKTLTVYRSGKIENSRYKIYDRKLKSKSTIKIKPGQKKEIRFYHSGSPTMESTFYNYIYAKIKYDGKTYSWRTSEAHSCYKTKKWKETYIMSYDEFEEWCDRCW